MLIINKLNLFINFLEINKRFKLYLKKKIETMECYLKTWYYVRCFLEYDWIWTKFQTNSSVRYHYTYHIFFKLTYKLLLCAKIIVSICLRKLFLNNSFTKIKNYLYEYIYELFILGFIWLSVVVFR